MSDLLQDIKFGCRVLFKNPSYAIIALLILGFGIGANAAIYSYIDGVLLRPLPYPNGDRIVRVMTTPPNGGGLNPVCIPDFLDWQKQTGVFETLTAQRWEMCTLTGIDQPLQIPVERVSVHFFDVFRTRAQLGRTFAEDEDDPGKERVAVLSHSFWAGQFGSDPKIIGRTFLVDGDIYTVIGVMPAGAFDTTATKMWRPIAFTPETMKRDNRWVVVWGSLKPDIHVDRARAEMNTLAKRIAADFPDSNKNWGITVDSLRSILVPPEIKRSLYLLMSAVAAIFLIACANVANLTLARGIAREPEVAVRAAIGAHRGRLLRQFLTESLVLSMSGGVLGVAIAYFGLGALKRFIGGELLTANVHVEMDQRILLFIVVLALVSGIAMGIYPAWQASRTDLTKSIQSGGTRGNAGRAGQGLQRILVAAEVSIAFVLLTIAGLLIHSFRKLQNVDIGVDTARVLVAELPIRPNQFKTSEGLHAYLRQMLEALRAVPGVSDAALTTAVPLDGWGFGMPFEVAGSASTDTEHRPVCCFKMVTPAYFSVLKMRLLRGRFLDQHDTASSAPVVVISETMAKTSFKGQSPIGQRLNAPRFQGLLPSHDRPPMTAWEVVGVIADERLEGLGKAEGTAPVMYVPTDQSLQPYQAIIVRSIGDTRTVERPIVAAVHGVNPDQALNYLQTLDQLKADSIGHERINSVLVAIFALVAVVLSTMGLYAVISYMVARRTREIGIRMALGATTKNILGLVARNAITLTTTGLVVGFILYFFVSRALASMLFGVERFDPLTFWSVIGLLILVTGIASYIPARRAAKVNPMIAIRNERRKVSVSIHRISAMRHSVSDS